MPSSRAYSRPACPAAGTGKVDASTIGTSRGCPRGAIRVPDRPTEQLAAALQVIVGGRLGTTFSYADGLALWEKAPNAQNVHVIAGAGHYELYDEPRYVDGALDTLDTFYQEFLAA